MAVLAVPLLMALNPMLKLMFNSPILIKVSNWDLRKALVQLMSQSIPTGYIPPGNPPGLVQKPCPGDRDLTFESCPGPGNSTRAGILWKMKLKLKKNSVDQIFTGENKQKNNKNKQNFLPFLRFTCFFNRLFSGLSGSIL